ncbi:cupin domain-containing protein [Halorientalis halophila]|uniref:cupin domain-containing protein n=1 Tax=Halorientalis halophila TaxID=3108499 RepID=UPI00300A969E
MTDDTDAGIVVRDTADLPRFGGGEFASQIVADETVGVENVSVGVVTFEPGAEGSRHVREVEEIVYVLEGEAEIVTDEETHGLTAGQAAVIPPGVHHRHVNVGSGPLRKLWIFAPQGPEEAIRDREVQES